MLAGPSVAAGSRVSLEGADSCENNGGGDGYCYVYLRLHWDAPQGADDESVLLQSPRRAVVTSNGSQVASPQSGCAGSRVITCDEGLLRLRYITTPNLEISPIGPLEARLGDGDDRLRIDSLDLPWSTSVNGEDGDDILIGGDGEVEDLLGGGAGNDRLYGRGGDDVLADGEYSSPIGFYASEDLFVGGPGFDRVYPGAGSDTIDVRDGEADYVECKEHSLADRDTLIADDIDTIVNCR